MRTRLLDRFGPGPYFFPVIHCVDERQSLAQAELAAAAAARGVFLIDQGGVPGRELPALARKVKARFPGLLVGVNRLGQPLSAADAGLEGVDAFWTDNAGVVDDTLAHDALHLGGRLFLERPDTPLYFGGVAFKGQRQPRDLELTASRALPFMDVTCTSGPGTGLAADLEKVERLRAGLGRHLLALASGVTPENVGRYLPFVDAFLVATGVSVSWDRFDPAKLRDVAQQIDAVRQVRPAKGVN
jgi:hypothetical protein